MADVRKESGQGWRTFSTRRRRGGCRLLPASTLLRINFRRARPPNGVV
jgi:hypothetical protein